MAAGQAPNNKETVYNTRVLSKWFAIASILLLVMTVWAAIQDYARPWKVYQRQGQSIATAVNERKLLEADKAMDRQQLESIEAEMSEIQARQAQVTKEIDEKIASIDARLYAATKKYQDEKGKLDEAHYIVESAIKARSPNLNELLEQYKKDQAAVARLARFEERYRLQMERALEDKRDILSRETELNSRLMALTRTRDQLTRAISNTEMSLVNLARNAPLLDFIAPTIKVNQVILNGLYDDYFFNKVPRVDRCMTCHVNAAMPGYEDFPQPFTSHPKLHLMVGAESPHPMERIGCTVCHAGVPQSVDFKNAAHTPRDEIQAAEWKEKYGFYYNTHIKTHMIPLQMTEGKCLQCHAQEVVFKDAPTLDAGLRLVEAYGCYGCHKFAGHLEQLAEEKKAGPALTRVASKVDQNWIKKWLWNPKSYRPTTFMPSYWQTHNNSDEASLERGKVEVDAITHWLVAKSEPYEALKLSSQALGDATRGRQLVEQVGCLGCHAINDVVVQRPEDPNVLGYKDPRVPMFGPELNQMGSKVSPEWLMAWLKEPQHYWAGTSMPSMKLSDQEAADITTYLLEKRNPEFDALPAPVASADVRDEVVLEFLVGELPTRDARVKLASMSLEDKRMFLGEKLISHYGCYGCHAIQGFEDAPNIGAELTTIGSKEVTTFAFENVQLPYTAREGWIYTKIRTPRVWDVGKKRDFQAKARMPHFGFTQEQANAIATVVIGHENRNVSSEMMAPVDGRREQIIAGRRVALLKNCMGCHALEDKEQPLGGHILAHYGDKSEGPPLLYTQGEKTQSDWLFRYLKNPSVVIRPWVKARMPVFGLSDPQASALTSYFAAYDRAPYPFTSKHANVLSASDMRQAEGLFNELGCMTCHAVLKPGQDPSGSAPHFNNVKARLGGEWTRKWLEDPEGIMPGTRMPALWPTSDPLDPNSARLGIPGYFDGDADRQMNAIRDYIFQYGGAPDPLPPLRQRPVAAPVSSEAQGAASAR
jgi:cytochrome c2